MNRFRSTTKPNDTSSRSGSTLLIVVALMGMMAFLGFVFYTFAAQEKATAVAHADGAKIRTAPSIEPDTLFDFVLQQVLIGPNDFNFQSVLWGGRHSLLANMFGLDNVPWNGEGINLISGASGQPLVDMDYDNTQDTLAASSSLLNVVDSPAANFGTKWGPTSTIPTPDVNYNSPDINSMFLSYDGIALNNTGANPTRVIIPSYFRPQYLRGGTLPANWFQDAAANQIMRPHPSHVCVDNSTGAVLTLGGTPINRFVNATQYQGLGLRRPFPFAPLDNTGLLPTTGRLGIWSNDGASQIELDVDTDGDGIMDAILMDLGYPPTRRGDGKLVVPLFAISIRDLNGLLNVNATGNLSGNVNFNAVSSSYPLGFRKTGPGTSVPDNLSKSNQGLSSYEINIQRALTADPTDVQSNNQEIAKQLAYFLFQFDPTVTQPGRSVTELANLEWLFLNIGRAQFHLGLAKTASPIQSAITDIFLGRHGEISRFRNFLSAFGSPGTPDIPRAGLSVTSYATIPPGLPDDNNNYNDGELIYNTRWVNPLDMRGAGQMFVRSGLGIDNAPGVIGVDDDGNGIIDDAGEEGFQGSDDSTTPRYGKSVQLYRNNNGPLLWPKYVGFHSFGTVRWGESATTGTYSSQLMQTSRFDSLMDEPAESIIDPVLQSTAYSGASFINNAVTNDSTFGAEELPFLQGSNADSRLTDTRSRLADLMPANLVASIDSADIRKRLTTVSSDRREFGLAAYPVGATLNPVGPLRQWETNPQFPPSIGGASNPYRPELFNHLKNAASAKLNVNRLLYLDSNTGRYGFAPLPEQTSVGDIDATIARQEMARDIYTLLYTLCQGTDVDYRIATGPTAPTADAAKEMAQFAVNLVDALDTDNIITVFKYDSDLTGTGGGWVDADATNLVYGVERQLLTFTETLGIQVVRRNDNANSKLTIFDDAATDATNGRLYLYFELQNVSPTNVTLASADATPVNVNAGTAGDWRVRLVDPTEATQYNVLTFLNGLDPAKNLVQSDASGNKYITAGQSFTVSSQDGTDKAGDGTFRTSDFRWDASATDGIFEVVVPSTSHDGSSDAANIPTTSTNHNQFPTPRCNLDLVWDYGGGVNRFVLSNNAGFTASVLGVPIVKMILERRAADGTANGVWVPVDKTSPIVFAANQVTPPAMDVATAAKVMQSNSRKTAGQANSPLNRQLETAGNATFNTASTNASSICWQWQPDRDFGTLTDLLFVPVYAPIDVTNGRLVNSEFCELSGIYYPTVAAARFLRPDNPDLTLNGTANTGNRWYRLFDFLEVPNRSHQHPAVRGLEPSGSVTWAPVGTSGRPATFASIGTLGTTANNTPPATYPLPEPYNFPQFFGWPRTHGLVNLNMIRHPQVLLALLDDDQLISDPRTSGLTTPNLYSMDEGNARDWWLGFLQARDSRVTNAVADPLTSLYLPGTPNSRPFRSLDSLGVSSTSTTDSPLENTLFRSLPVDTGLPNPNDRRRLFEVGTSTEHQGPLASEVGNTVLHPMARYRLISKLMGNTTTRSNSFAVFITAQYHEAVEVATDSNTNAVRIGGKLNDAPVHRGFFVVDRTSAVEQMKTITANGFSAHSLNSTYSFRPNADVTGLRPNMNGIRWKDLVLFRQTLN